MLKHVYINRAVSLFQIYSKSKELLVVNKENRNTAYTSFSMLCCICYYTIHYNTAKS